MQRSKQMFECAMKYSRNALRQKYGIDHMHVDDEGSSHFLRLRSYAMTRDMKRLKGWDREIPGYYLERKEENMQMG